MKDFLQTYKTEVLTAASFLYVPFIVFVIALGVVYLFGRMLEVCRSPRSKNGLALSSMVASYIFYFRVFLPKVPFEQRVWQAFIYLAVSVILYVLLGFKLYERVDAFLDKKLGEDLAGSVTEEPPKTVVHAPKPHPKPRKPAPKPRATPKGRKPAPKK